jgi:hypothetical protein
VVRKTQLLWEDEKLVVKDEEPSSGKVFPFAI